MFDAVLHPVLPTKHMITSEFGALINVSWFRLPVLRYHTLQGLGDALPEPRQSLRAILAPSTVAVKRHMSREEVLEGAISCRICFLERSVYSMEGSCAEPADFFLVGVRRRCSLQVLQ